MIEWEPVLTHETRKISLCKGFLPLSENKTNILVEWKMRGISRKFTKGKTCMAYEDFKKYVFNLTVSGECKVKQDLTTVSPGGSLCPGGKGGMGSQGTEMPRAQPCFGLDEQKFIKGW